MLPAYLFKQHTTAAYQTSENDGCSQLEIMEKEALLASLARNEWIQQKAAREIGLTLRQMGYRVKKYNLGRIIREKKKFQSLSS